MTIPSPLRSSFVLVATACIAVSVVACPRAESQPVAVASSTPPPPTHPTSPAHWGYESSDGPARWATLDDAFAACASGHEQSPIDLPKTASKAEATEVPSLHFAPVPLRFIDNGHTIQANADGSSSAQLGGATFSLAQFHFHLPSEHTVNGKAFDAELHAVFKTADGHLLVVGVLLAKGAENQVLAPLFAALPADAVGKERAVAGTAIDLGALVGASPHLFHYAGSLTTPPCTEGVAWYVVDPASAAPTLSDAQLAKLSQAVHGDNHRPTQPLGTRAVKLF